MCTATLKPAAVGVVPVICMVSVSARDTFLAVTVRRAQWAGMESLVIPRVRSTPRVVALDFATVTACVTAFLDMKDRSAFIAWQITTVPPAMCTATQTRLALGTVRVLGVGSVCVAATSQGQGVSRAQWAGSGLSAACTVAPIRRARHGVRAMKTAGRVSVHTRLLAATVQSVLMDGTA